MFQGGRQLLHLGAKNFVFRENLEFTSRRFIKETPLICFSVGDSSSTCGSRISFLSRKFRVHLTKIYEGKPFDMFQGGRQLLHQDVKNFVFPAKILSSPREDLERKTFGE